MKHLTIKGEDAMRRYAASFWHSVNDQPIRPDALVVCLYGDLGAGKTTFVKSVAVAAGVSDVVTSPTFVIMKKYHIQETSSFKQIVHVDAYRLKRGDDREALGWSEIRSNPDNIIFVEWPEHVSGSLPKETIDLRFEFIDEDTREITTNKTFVT